MSGEIKAPDPVDWGTYEDGGAGKPLPPKGEYEVEVTGIQVRGQDGNLLRSKDGYFQPIVDLKVIAAGQPFDGFLSRFNRFNTKRWPSRNGNGVADLLRGFGFTGPFNTDDEYAAAADATKGRRCRAMLDWEIYDSATGTNLKGMESFPTDANGVKQSKITNNGATLYANVRAKYIISAVKK